MNNARTRMKFCGITRPEDAELAVVLGVDAIGLVRAPVSKRYVSLDQGAQISRCIPAFVTCVGLFVDPDEREVEQSIEELGLDLLQFHGDESPEFCASFDRPYIKAVRMRETDDLLRAVRVHAGARGFLVDAFNPGAHGGTGECFDWNLLPETGVPLILAGGLSANNVALAIREVRPYAVDVSSGIESVPGTKDADRMRAFVEAVQSADQA